MKSSRGRGPREPLSPVGVGSGEPLSVVGAGVRIDARVGVDGYTAAVLLWGSSWTPAYDNDDLYAWMFAQTRSAR